MRDSIIQSIQDAIRAVGMIGEPQGVAVIESAAQMIVSCFQKGNKLLIAGNGGSLCDAIHFAEELTGQFRKQRAALPALALADPGSLTAISNDMGFENVFARSIEALGRPGDIFFALTTSGNSENLISAAQRAKERHLQTIAFLGKTGGRMKGLCDLEWIVSGFPHSDRIQEAHMTAIHIIIDVVERQMFSHS